METRDVVLRWKDTNQIEQGHRIYRSYEPFDMENLPPHIGEVGQNVTSFTDFSQPIGETVHYIVSAFTPFGEQYSNPITFMVTPVSFAYIGSNDGSLIQYDNEGIQVWIDFDNTSTPIEYMENDSSGNVIFSSLQVLTKFSAAGTKAWDYTAPTNITSIATDNTGNVFISHGSILRLIDSTGNEGWSYDNGTDAIVSIDYDEVNNTVYISDSLSIKAISEGTLVNTLSIENVDIVKCDRFEYLYYVIDSVVYRHDTFNDITYSVDFSSTINDISISESNGIYVAVNGKAAYLNFESFESWDYDEYSDNVTSISVNTLNESLITVGLRAVKLTVNGSKQWENSYTDLLDSSTIFSGNTITAPIDVDFDYRHFYEPTDLEFFSS